MRGVATTEYKYGRGLCTRGWVLINASWGYMYATARKGKRKLEDDSEECWNYSSTVIVEMLYEEKIKFIFFEEIENTWMCGNMKL